MKDRLIKMASAVIASLAITSSMIPVSFGDSAKEYKSIPVTLNASACSFNASVPSCMPYYVTSDGNVYTSDSVVIDNHSIGRIEMMSMKISEDGVLLAHDVNEYGDDAAINVITGSHELPASGRVKTEELRIIDGDGSTEIAYAVKANGKCAPGMHVLSTVIVLGWNK